AGVDASGAVSAGKAMTIDRFEVDRRPTTHNGAITIPKGDAYVFSVADFPFAETGDHLTKVEIESLPRKGTLTLGGIAVKAEQKIAIADIAAGKLVYTPPAGASGFDFSQFRFEVVD